MNISKNPLNRLTVRSIVILLLVIGCLAIAIIDISFRPTFGDIAKIGIGGYLGQLIPEKDNSNHIKI